VFKLCWAFLLNAFATTIAFPGWYWICRYNC